MIPYGRQQIDEEDILAVVDVLRSDFLTTGPAVGLFERALCQYTGAKHAVVVNSGTAALHAAYFAAGLQPGDEIITSPLTFAATANAALYLGAKVRFVDVEPDTGNIDPERIEEAITPRTKLIVPIDFTGQPANYDRIRQIADKHNLLVVADAAHSLGASYHGHKVGILADITATSFHPVKPITTAEGGAIFTHRQDFADRAGSFRTHGIIRDPKLMQNPEGTWYYEMHDLGFNYRLPDVLCALGLSQLSKLDRFLARRRQIAAIYSQELAGLPALTLPSVAPDIESGWHLYVVQVNDPAVRQAAFGRLRELGLGVQVHYIPVHFHPYYQRLGYKRGSLPVAEDFYARSISLPIFPAMTDEDVSCVVSACVKVFS